MALLKRFENAEFGQLSVIVKDGKEYMDGIHVATMLGYLNPRDAIVRQQNFTTQGSKKKLMVVILYNISKENI